MTLEERVRRLERAFLAYVLIATENEEKKKLSPDELKTLEKSLAQDMQNMSEGF